MNEIALTPTGNANDDTAALQAAIDNPCTGQITIEPGVFAIGKRATRAGVRIADRPSPLVIRGAHEHGTILKLVDMAGGIGGDCHVLAFDRCNDLTLSNFTLDGNRATFPGFDQQAHGLYVNGCRRVMIESVHTRNVIMDGAYFIGEAAENEPLVEDVTILNTTHTDNNRSGLAFQRGARNVLIDGLIAQGVSDAAIDTEATGRPGENFTIRNVTVYPVTDAFGLSVGGYAGLPCLNFLVENVEIYGGSMSVYHAHNLSLHNVTIHGGNLPPLTLRGNLENVLVRGGYYLNRAAGNVDPAVSLGQYNGALPGRVTFQGVTVVAANGQGGIYAEDTDCLELVECHLLGTGTGAGVGMRNVSRTAGVAGLRLQGGTISHFADGITARPYSDRVICSLISQGVTGYDLARGVYVEGAAYLTHRVIRNEWRGVGAPEVYE